jgi:hypothetical protein
MAKRRSAAAAEKISKSQAVRDYLAEHPRAKPKEIRPAVKAAHGLDISPQMISMIKSKSRRRRGRRGTAAAEVRAAGRVRTNASRITVEDLVSAKKLAGQLGGISRAQELLAALARLS